MELELTYSCAACKYPLHLSSKKRYSPGVFFEGSNRGTLSFTEIDETRFKQQEEAECMPFFETVNYWGLQRIRTKLLCANCDHPLGYIYDDGPPVNGSKGQYGFGPSQVVPRMKRYRIKIRALEPDNEDLNKSSGGEQRPVEPVMV
eukprot:TRINITY_DN13047_c0_g1_i1.p1 TRINITY_DN13047_c0_g1~~TRINITY_DN13047_c0_g1_i1.p1  ORF type:complete len:146 (-),score=22.64 TRINITY_DN13047_c0_g1_i1:665-1102(-)